MELEKLNAVTSRIILPRHLDRIQSFSFLMDNIFEWNQFSIIAAFLISLKISEFNNSPSIQEANLIFLIFLIFRRIYFFLFASAIISRHFCLLSGTDFYINSPYIALDSLFFLAFMKNQKDKHTIIITHDFLEVMF